MNLTELVEGIDQIVEESEPDYSMDQDALDGYYAVKCIDDNDPTQTERLEVGYDLKPLIKIKLGEKPVIEPGKSYFSPENTSFMGATYILTGQKYKAIEQLVKKYRSTQVIE